MLCGRADASGTFTAQGAWPRDELCYDIVRDRPGDRGLLLERAAEYLSRSSYEMVRGLATSVHANALISNVV